jgi:hypothetical protein
MSVKAHTKQATSFCCARYQLLIDSVIELCINIFSEHAYRRYHGLNFVSCPPEDYWRACPLTGVLSPITDFFLLFTYCSSMQMGSSAVVVLLGVVTMVAVQGLTFSLSLLGVSGTV